MATIGLTLERPVVRFRNVFNDMSSSTSDGLGTKDSKKYGRERTRRDPFLLHIYRMGSALAEQVLLTTRNVFKWVGGTLAKPFVFIASLFKKSDPGTPVIGCYPRISNIAVNNYRGLLGVIPVIYILWRYSEKGNHSRTVELMWIWMLWFALCQPVSIPVIGLIPIFFLPMTGVIPSVDVCQCYMNENVALFIITWMMNSLLNNSGADRRIAIWLMCSGDYCQYSAKRLILKVSTASFFLSMFCSRLITSSVIIDYMTQALITMKSTAPEGGPDFDEIRYIMNNAIQTASGIGSTAILHSSYVTLLFKAVWSEAPPEDKKYPDIFNYIQYSAFAFPVAFIMYILNCGYHMLLIDWVVKEPMSAARMTALKDLLLKYKAELPRRVTLHEKLSVLFLVAYLSVLFTRWGRWVGGWAQYNKHEEFPLIPRVKDVTPAALFAIVLHMIPKSYGFLDISSAEVKSELPPLKPESSILWWRFVDKNVAYGYIFMFGGAIALMNSARITGLGQIISENMGRIFTEKPWNSSIFLVVFVASILSNVISAIAACAVFVPFVMCMSVGAPIPWPGKVYCGALGAGIASNFGFCIPFLYTPGYYCHYNGKVPIKKMIKYSFISVWICLIILWYALTVWAPYIFDPDGDGIFPVDGPPDNPNANTTAAGAETPPEAAEP